MVLKIRQIGDPVLEQVAKPVEDIMDSKIQKLVDDMIETCRADIDRTAGLSAPQVGESLAISICRRFDISEDADDWEVMFNPEITAKSSEISTIWEGCLSIGTGDTALYGPVTRSKRVEVSYTDREGVRKKLKGEDYFSHVIQHEVDHTRGILFLKYVPNPDKNLWLSKDLDRYIDSYGEFPPIA